MSFGEGGSTFNACYIRLYGIFTIQKSLNIPPGFVVQVRNWLGSLVESRASLIVRTVKLYILSTK